MSFGSDPWLDAKLRNVPLPVGLIQRLNQVGAEQGSAAQGGAEPVIERDPQLDAELANVRLPRGFIERLEAIGRTPRRLVEVRRLTDLQYVPLWQQFALAASLVVAVGMAYSTLVNRGRAPHDNVAHQPGNSSTGLAARPAGSGLTEHDPAANELSPSDWEHERLLHQPELAEGQLDPTLSSEGDLVEFPAMPDEFEFSPILPPLPNVTTPKIGADSLFGSVSRSESLPVLESLRLAAPHGIVPPLVPGYDVLFELKHGDHPFASPSAHADLRSLRVPLVTDRGSFDLTWRALREGRQPAASEIRIEEFLAAVDYDFAAPSAGSAVAIRTAAGPSPLGEPGWRMLQVGVQAGPLAQGTHPATNVTVAVDTSASMRRTGRLDLARRAVVDLSEHLRTQDRLTVVMLDSQAEIVIDHADRENIARVFSAIQALPPQGAAQPNRSLESALAAARRPDGSVSGEGKSGEGKTAEGSRSRRLVLLTDGATDFGLGSTGQSEKLLTDAAAAGIKLLIVDLARAEEPSPQLTALARVGQGDLKAAATADQVRFAVLEAVTGSQAIVAKQASLRVTFNPATVAGYRLLGHEATTLTGTGAAAQVDLRADQAATALFELWFKPAGGDDIATAEVEWQDPQTGQMHKISQRISRVQFAKSFAESPLSLQAAAVAAEAAETLRGSYFAPSSRPLTRVLDLASQVSPRLGERASFRALVTLVRQAEKVRSHGVGSRTAKTQPLE